MLQARNAKFGEAAYSAGREPYMMAVLELAYGTVKTPTVTVSSLEIGAEHPAQINQGYIREKKYTTLSDYPELDSKHFGWRSRELSDTLGMLSVPETIELTYPEEITTPRIAFWGNDIYTLRNFKLSVYGQGGLVHEEIVTDHKLPYWFTTMPTGASYNRVRLEVTRINNRGGNIQMMFFGPIHRLVFLPNIVRDFNLTEDLVTPGSDPLGQVNANELDIAFENFKDWFTPENSLSPLNGIFFPKMEIWVMGGFKVEKDLFELITFGQFFTSKWSATRITKETSILCFDRMEQIIDMPLPPIPLIASLTPVGFLRFLFGKLGFVEGVDYIIDTQILDTPRRCWTGATTYGEAMQQIAIAGMFYINCNRRGQIYAIAHARNVPTLQTFTGSNLLRSTTVPFLYRTKADSVEVSYYNSYLTVKEEVWSAEVTIPAGQTYTVTEARFSKPVAQIPEIALSVPVGVGIVSYTPGAQAAAFSLQNSTGQDQLVKLSIRGDAFDPSAEVVTMRNTDDLRAVTTTIDNQLIQTKEEAEKLALRVLTFLGDGTREVTSEWRVDPRTELGDKVDITNPAHKVVYEGVIVRSLITRYNGGFSGTMVTQREVGVSS